MVRLAAWSLRKVLQSFILVAHIAMQFGDLSASANTAFWLKFPDRAMFVDLVPNVRQLFVRVVRRSLVAVAAGALDPRRLCELVGTEGSRCPSRQVSEG